MRQRVLTAALAIPLVVGVVVAQDPTLLLILLCVVGTLCANELVSLLAPGDSLSGQILSLGVVLLLIVGGFSPVAGLIVLAVSVALTLLAKLPFWAPLYIGLPLWAILYLHGGVYLFLNYGGDGFFEDWVWNWRSPVFMVLLPLWLGDSLALFVGKAIGKRPLAPGISPNKTLEGAVANLLGCVIVSALLAGPLEVPLWKGLLCGISTGVLGQMGDLFESSIKRKADRKDSGGLLPGHGGLLDRIDSLLFASLPVLVILRYLPSW